MERLSKILTSMALVLVLIIPGTVMAEEIQVEEPLVLTRALAEEMLLTDNETIKGLETAQQELFVSYNDILAAGEGLGTMYGQLDQYSELDGKYTATMANSDYAAYFNLLMKGVGAGREDDLDVYVIELESEDLEGNETLIGEVNQRIALESSFNEEDYDAMITPGAYSQYKTLEGIFSGMGITEANPDRETIYDTFIYTMEVAPLSLQAGLETLALNREVVGGNLVAGMNTLYDTILSMENTLNILYTSYVSTENTANVSDAKLPLGLVTASENRQSHIDANIAELEYNQMVRNIDNMILSLKDMIGMDPQTKIVLDESPLTSGAIKDLDDYMTLGHSKRSEVVIAEIDIRVKTSEVEIMEDWFSATSDRMEEAEEALDKLEEDLTQVEREVTVDIIKAYRDVDEAEMAWMDAENDLTLAEKQFEALVLRSEMGYILETDLTAMEVSVIAAENALAGAQIGYNGAVRALEIASGQ